MTAEFKLVPVETLKFALGIARHGFKNRTDQEADKYAALKTITEILESPTPPQPIYDEAKERELFEVWAIEEIGPYFNKHEDCLVRTDHGGYVYGQTVTSWQAWLACAQSRAKAGEPDHE